VPAVVGEGQRAFERALYRSGKNAEHGVQQCITRDEGAQVLQAFPCVAESWERRTTAHTYTDTNCRDMGTAWQGLHWQGPHWQGPHWQEQRYCTGSCIFE
jgi:hypothetical protein